MTQGNSPIDLEEVWRIREDERYPQLFGGASRGIFTLDSELFERFGRPAVDPRWLTYGIFEYGPTQERPYWLSVTSGHSNPWEDEPEDYDPNGQSGAGVEFLFASTVQGDWAIRYLQNMLAFELLLCSGHFPNKGPLLAGHRIPLRAPINGKSACELRNAIISGPETLPSGFALPSGKVEFLTFTGISDGELAFAKEHGSPALIERLRAAGGYPVTDPERPSTV